MVPRRDRIDVWCNLAHRFTAKQKPGPMTSFPWTQAKTLLMRYLPHEDERLIRRFPDSQDAGHIDIVK